MSKMLKIGEWVRGSNTLASARVRSATYSENGICSDRVMQESKECLVGLVVTFTWSNLHID
jgi:hypothetical protein